MKVIFYENKEIQKLYPIAYTRPAFDIFCGATTLYQVITEVFGSSIDYLIRQEILETASLKSSAAKSSSDKILYLDASLVPSFDLAINLFKLLAEKNNCLIKNNNEVIGFLSSELISDFRILVDADFKLNDKTEAVSFDWPTFNYSWDTIIYNQEVLSANLEHLKKSYQEIKPGVFVGKNVDLAENIVMDTKKGIIVIDNETRIMPFSHLAGPLYIGKNCLIKEFSSIKDNCCFGPVCKIGGEVESTIIQGYSNKQHYGFLGHSYLGEWINIAAGTSNSDLKNTYSRVKINGIDTGQQFLGTVIGDYSRTAINTSIFTGRVIGVSSFIYGTITRDIVSFTNYAAHLGCVIELALDVAIKAQQAMFARRGREQTAEDINLLTQIFEATKVERNKENICPGRLEFKI